MARIRTVKPEFFTSEDIVSLSPMARLLYIALWCESDREGRMAWKPRTFKMRYFPADKCDIDALARELIASRLVILYGDGLAYIPSFSKHQHVNPRETASDLPHPPRVSDASGRVDSPSVTHREEGKERKGREGEDHASGREGDSDTNPFEEFWSAWPRKTAKAEAEKAFRKLKPSRELLDKILADIRRRTSSADWADQKFIPYPATYLNGKRWEDEPAEKKPNLQVVSEVMRGVL